MDATLWGQNDYDYEDDYDENDWDCAFCEAVNHGDENWCHECGKHYLESALKKKKNRSGLKSI